MEAYRLYSECHHVSEPPKELTFLLPCQDPLLFGKESGDSDQRDSLAFPTDSKCNQPVLIIGSYLQPLGSLDFSQYKQQLLLAQG